MEPPTVPHAYTPDDFLADRRARRYAGAIPGAALTWIAVVALGVVPGVVGIAIGVALVKWGLL